METGTKLGLSQTDEHSLINQQEENRRRRKEIAK